ncbi:o-succinylbenzoate--CoA ligase [Bacillus massiliglaciei]|uniref:o-succinylbenzoate--CoA ligase n=1 Tax=Bacillus massiliglaciei TaxID=1816693 RepID=UPI000A4E4D21|nr:o-succinylbenzoate--CoA ligase [Bacillus massiliglaciei]
MEERLPNWLMKRAHLTPNRPAVEFEGRTLTFLELHQEAEKMARRLACQGVRKDDTAAILLRNHLDSVIIIHALLYLGVKMVMLNSKLTSKELSWQAGDSGAQHLISEQFFSEKLAGIEFPHILQKEQWTGEKEAPIQEEFPLEDTATIMYTSGTTGNPKGVIQTFGNHWWSAVGSALNLGLREDDCWYCAVPIFHISGFSILMKNIIYGMKIVVVQKFEAEAVNQAIMKGNVTICSVVTTMLNRMLEDLKGTSYPNTFRCALLGGGPAPKHMLERCRDQHIPVFQSYGMTETASQIVTLSPEDSLKKVGSAGKPLFPAQLRIEQAGREAEPEEPGEIVVKGPNVTKGYYNRPDATEEAIRQGWLYTGDIGYVDAEGFLYVLDRRSDLIISGGENVYPAEIEAVLSSHPAVFEAGVTKMEDAEWGQVPVAFVVLHEGVEAGEQELREYCRQALAAYKVPKEIHYCKELPRNGANKLLRRNLKRQV